MKHKHIFSLLDTSFTTVAVVFGIREAASVPFSFTSEDYHPWDEVKVMRDGRVMHQGKAPPPPPHAPNLRSYVYKVPKAWDVKLGQVVIVPTKDQPMGFATVVRVDETPDIDIDADHDYKWIIQVVDMTEYERLVDNEKRFAQGMLEVERTKQRETLINSFRDSLPEGSEARRLFEQTTSALAAPTPPPVATPSPAAAPDEAAPWDAPNPDDGHLK